jgi:hypothetical protein
MVTLFYDIRTMMSFKIRWWPLYLVVAMSVRYADAQTETLPVIGLPTGFDQITGNPPSRLDIRVLTETGGPMW